MKSKKKTRVTAASKGGKQRRFSAFGRVVAFFRDERIRLCLGMIFIITAVLLCLSFTSYLVTWQTDQSIVAEHTLGELIFGNDEYEINNMIGTVGAVVSNKFIHDSFGLASFIIVVILIVFGLNLLNIKPVKNIWRFTFIAIVVGIWLSIALAALFVDKYFLVGGAHGYFIYAWLTDTIGKIGAYLTILFVGFVIFMFCFKNSFNKLKVTLLNLKNIRKKDLIDNDLPKIFESGKASAAATSTAAAAASPAETQSQEEIILEDDGKESATSRHIDLEQVIVSDEEEAVMPATPAGGAPATAASPQMSVNRSADEAVVDDDDVSGIMEDYDPTKDLEFYTFPPIDLLLERPAHKAEIDTEELNNNKDKIVKTLQDYKIEISKISATIGPTVTLYKIMPAPGVRINKIRNLEDDIALSLAALGIRIIAPIPGESNIGIEVPNKHPEIVPMRSVIKSVKFQESKYDLPVAIGKTITNETYVFNLAKTPHLLVAGATGQGKSVGINAIITSLLYKMHPSRLKFVFVDPKMVELSIYRHIEKHYLAKLPNEDNPIITDVSKVVPTMESLCIEMDRRYTLLTAANVRNISEYNDKFIHRKLNPANGHAFMPYIVVVIDEFADIIVQEGKQVEVPISRLAAKARAIGIHLILATQRPSTDVITGVIKANFPTRIAFKVTNGHDSITILDNTGAKQLIGRGDMLISEGGTITRVQCAFVDTPEVENIVNFISQQQGYPEVFELPEPENTEEVGESGSFDMFERDPMFAEAARTVVRHQQGSTSLIQRKLSLGYNRAGRIIDQLEAAGIVGPYEGSKARQVLIPDEYSLEQFLQQLR